jgi:RNA polymerase sigma-70 factor, ECF subfamily
MSPAPPTDLDLVRALHARDRRALARIYADNNAAIYNLCARVLGDREEAKDVTQEVLLKAFASPPAATQDVRLRPWLFRVATNTCLNLIRSRRDAGREEPDSIAATCDPYEQARSAP